jgi:hypothetical protein
MRTWTTLLVAAPVAMGLVAAPAYADWGHRGGWHGYERHHEHRGDGIAAALLGLGAAALIGGLLASTPPPAYSAPPPVTYAPPPAYYPPPGYAAPPGYYYAP